MDGVNNVGIGNMPEAEHMRENMRENMRETEYEKRSDNRNMRESEYSLLWKMTTKG